MADRIKFFAVFLAVVLIAALCTVTGFTGSASASPTVICTWTGAASTDLSVANNWSPAGAPGCGGSSTTPGSATLSGAELVFPSSIPSTGSMLTADAPESVNDLLFNAGYTIMGSGALTLTPSGNSSVGIDVTGGEGATITAPIDLGLSQTFVSASSQYLYLNSVISGSGYSLTFGSTGNSGTIELSDADSYSGPTTISDGTVEIKNSASLGTGAVTVNSGASLLEYSLGVPMVDPTNSLTISGPGSTYSSGALEDFTGGSGWAGPITLAGSTTIAAESNGHPFVLSGSIGGLGPLTFSGSGTFDFKGGSSDFSGVTTIGAFTTVVSGAANALPATTDLTVSSGAKYDLSGYVQSLAGLSGSGTVTSSSATPTTITISPAGTDTVDTTISGDIGLVDAGSGTAILDSSSNTFSQGTSIQSGTLEAGVSNALPSGSSLSVAASGSYDLAGFDQALASITGAGTITSSSGMPLLSLDVGSGESDTWSGMLTGTLGLTASGPGMLVVTSAGNSYSGPTSITTGMMKVDGAITDSAFSVGSGATLEGTGTIGGISANSGLVHPGASPGILTSDGSVTLGNGSLGIDITGSQAGSGFSQLVAAGNTVDVSGTTLSVSDSYSAQYDTVFTIVSAGSIVGSFANAAWGSDIVAGGRSLLLGHTSTDVTLTDVTSPPAVQAPSPGPSGPVPPLPPSSAVSYSGGSSGGPSGTATATNDQISVSAIGEGAVTLSQFGDDPVGTPNFVPANEYFDLKVSSGNTFSSVTIIDCNLNGGIQLEWWNKTLDSGSGQWQPVSPAAILSQTSPPCLTFTVTASTQPSLSDLSDAVFAVAKDSASTPDGKGYWLVASDGGVFSFGDAQFYGSMGGKYLARPVVGMTATADGTGYWLVGQDGGVFSFGNAGFFGSSADRISSELVSAITASPSGKGYWLVASDGNIFSFGDAAYHSSLGVGPTSNPVVGCASTPDGNGYWLVAKDGGVFSFGDASYYGSMGGKTLAQPIVGIGG